MAATKTRRTSKGRSGSSSLTRDIAHRFRRNKTAMVALCFIVVVVLVAIFADVIVSYDVAITQNIKERYTAPCAAHWFGTDSFGRDIFARIVHGTRISLLTGVVTTLISVSLACLFGAVAGYYGGKVDNIIMRIMDVLISIPSILLMICIVAVMGAGTTNLIVALSISQIPGFTRIVRSVILNLKDADYIEAARASGSSNSRIIATHILPNALGPIIIQATMNISVSIIAAASLSYIGLGCQPPQPEWGIMLSEAKDQMRNYPYLMIVPGVAIVVTALSFNLMGDGLRDALDPRLKD